MQSAKLLGIFFTRVSSFPTSEKIGGVYIFLKSITSPEKPKFTIHLRQVLHQTLG